MDEMWVQRMEGIVLNCGHPVVACPSCGARTGPPSDAPTDATTGADTTVGHVFDLSTGTEIQTSTKAGLIEEPWFQRFWEVYPRRVGKKPAAKAFAGAVRAGAAPAAIVDAATAYAYAAKRKGLGAEFIKYPQGWLNDERWTDEPDKIEFETPKDKIVGSPEYAARQQAEEDAAIEEMGA